jgi:DNA sulfur modification protein DndD
MSLQFDSVSLKNFGPYRDVANLGLTTTETAPVVLIHGENTLGKTQLFSALRWCLYGSFQPQQTASQATASLAGRLNKPAQRDGENVMEVSMRLTAEGQPYELTRRAVFSDGSPTVSADLRIGSTVIAQASIDAEIGRLLHPQISEFFLFDAELMQRFYDRLNTDRERAFIRQSIDTVLGIPALQLAESDVSDLAREATQRQARATQSASESERINKRLKQIRDEQTSAEKDKGELHESLRAAERDLKDIKEKLAVVEGIQADAREQETLEASIGSGDDTEMRLRTDMRSLIGTGWRAPAAARLQEALNVVQARNSEAVRQQGTIAGVRTRIAVLEDQIRGGTCKACKQSLPEANPSTHDELAEQKTELASLLGTAPETPDLDTERKLSALIDHTTIERYQEKQTQLNELRALQYQRRRNLAQIKDRLAGNDAAAIRALGQQQIRLDDAIESMKRRQTIVQSKLTNLGSEQQRLARQLDRLPGAQPAVVLEANFFGFVQTLLNRTIERYQEQTRANVQAAASAMFMSLIRDPHGYGGLRISRDYKVELLDMHQHSRETSEGGKQLVALSLIGALKEAAVRGGPVVLDSPLARLDLDHRASVLSRWVPSLGSQAVLLVQSGELTREAAHEILGHCIGHEYRIYRPDDDPENAAIERTN